MNSDKKNPKNNFSDFFFFFLNTSIDTVQRQYYALQVFKLQDQRAQRNGADFQSPLIQSIRVVVGAAALRALTVRTAAPPPLSCERRRVRISLRCDKVYTVHGFMKHMT